MGSVRVPSISLRITSCVVFIPTEKVILTILRRGSSEVAYLSRFALLCLCPSCAYIPLYAINQTYSNIFISPSSSDSFADEDENGAARKQQRTTTNSQRKATKCNVANLLGMDGQVTPRSIAYAAVLVCLLTSLFSIISYHHYLSLSWPLISLMLATGWKSIITSIFVHCMH